MRPAFVVKLFLLLFLVAFLGSCTKTADDYTNSAMEKRGHKDYVGAIADYDKAIEIDPQNVNAYHGRAYAKKLTGDFSGAIQDYSKAIELKPTDGAPYAGRGGAKISMGDKEGGCADFKKGLELGYAGSSDLIKENCQ